MEKILVPLYENDVAPRFDLATDVLLVTLDPASPEAAPASEKVIVLPRASAEELCRLVMTENVNVVVCGGIEEEYRQFLTWKGVEVLDGVMGPVDRVLEMRRRGKLVAGAMLYGDDG